MAQRQITTPVASSEKALAAARDILSVRRRSVSSSMSFSAFGESQASKVTELPGFKDNHLSGEGSDGNRNSHDDAVTLSKQEADKASTKDPSCRRENKKGSLGADMHLMSVGMRLRVFLYTRYRRVEQLTATIFCSR